MEERSLRVLHADTTFFSKITTTISKLLVPTKVGINGMLISMKRNNVLKNYEAYKINEEISDSAKKENLSRKYEESYALYLEAIDKYVMDSIYTKVKNNNATDFEKEALSKYYDITRLKENEYVEYKNRKQKYLLELDFEGIKLNQKNKIYSRYVLFYITKADMLYKAILKNYSIRLSDGLNSEAASKEEIYAKIFKTLGEYSDEIMPLKMEFKNGECKEVFDEYDKIESFEVGKLDEINHIEKNMMLISLSRKMFTHSLPLIVAEQCYRELLRQTRELVVQAKVEDKRQRAYEILLKILEDYYVKLLSTKIYWEKPEERTEYKKFLDKYSKYKNETKKELTLIKEDLRQVNKESNENIEIIKFYKGKLVEAGLMRELKDRCKTISGRFIKK